MLKGSEVASASPQPSRYMLVPQKIAGEDTGPIEEHALGKVVWQALGVVVPALGGWSSPQGSAPGRGRSVLPIDGETRTLELRLAAYGTRRVADGAVCSSRGYA